MGYFSMIITICVCILIEKYNAATLDKSNGYPQARPLAPFTVEDDRASNYNFGYSVNAKDTGDTKQHEEVRNGNEVRGSYAVLDSDGGKRIVQYIANENGFNAFVQRGNHLNYQFPMHTRQHFFNGFRQGLHTNILDTNRYLSNLNALSPQQQHEFEKLLYSLGHRHANTRLQFNRNNQRNFLNGQNNQNRGINIIGQNVIPYNKPNGVLFVKPRPQQTLLTPITSDSQSQLNSSSHQCSFKQSSSKQNRNPTSKLKQYFDFRNRPFSVNEPYYNIDIRRSVPIDSYFNTQ